MAKNDKGPKGWLVGKKQVDDWHDFRPVASAQFFPVQAESSVRLASFGFPHLRGHVRRIGISTDPGLARWFKYEETSMPRIFLTDGTSPNPLVILAI